jgi:hypothetical protein
MKINELDIGNREVEIREERNGGDVMKKERIRRGKKEDKGISDN